MSAGHRAGESAVSATRLDFMGRDSIQLENPSAEALVSARGGMIPRFAAKLASGDINTHWIPPFRQSGHEAYDEHKHGSFWKSRLLYEIAGDFFCSPNFGPDCSPDGVPIPAHGWTASRDWDIQGFGLFPDGDSELAFAEFCVDSPDQRMPLSFRRIEALPSDGSVLYSATILRNNGDKALRINLGRHATLGPPFLESGCRIAASASSFATPPAPSEFSQTGRLLEGIEFKTLDKAPLRSGGTADLRTVPGMIGCTDLVSGPVPPSARHGWSLVGNPRLGLAHLVLFPGPASLSFQEIAPSFNTLWMQYGGRRFSPWAESEGGEDRSFCLGSECATAYFANGLEASLASPHLLGAPTTMEIPPHAERVMYYCLALARFETAPDAGEVDRLEEEKDGTLVLYGQKARTKIAMDASFDIMRRLIAGLPE